MSSDLLVRLVKLLCALVLTYSAYACGDIGTAPGMDLDTAGVIAAVVPGSCADQARMPVGARIVGVDGVAVMGRDRIVEVLAANSDSPCAKFAIEISAPVTS